MSSCLLQMKTLCHRLRTIYAYSAASNVRSRKDFRLQTVDLLNSFCTPHLYFSSQKALWHHANSQMYLKQCVFLAPLQPLRRKNTRFYTLMYSLPENPQAYWHLGSLRGQAVHIRPNLGASLWRFFIPIRINCRRISISLESHSA
jgi:hypothetical protein